MRNALSESVGNYAKEGGSESRARRPPLHSSQRARLENRGLTSDCCVAMIWWFVFHGENERRISILLLQVSEVIAFIGK